MKLTLRKVQAEKNEIKKSAKKEILIPITSCIRNVFQ